MDYLLLIWIHFISDFVFQPDKIALNKNDNLGYLGLHCLIYSLLFLYFGIMFALITGILHFIIDFFSSKLTCYFYRRKENHKFFMVIGCDQALHFSCLFLAYQLYFS